MGTRVGNPSWLKSVGTRVGKEMDVWEGMWWGPREKFAIWVHGNRISVRLMGLHFLNL